MSLHARAVVDVGELRLDVDLSLNDSEVVAVLGPNGAGKTSLLRAIAGLITLSQGRIVVDDEVLDDPTEGVRVPTERRPIGFVFQEYLLFPHLSVLDNVAFGLRAHGAGRKEADGEARRWLTVMGLDRHERSKPRELSGGQAQKVALARALAVRPRILLLDEPLAALDVAARAEVRRDLRRHLESFRGARLLVTHDPMEAMVVADRVVVLENGRVVQSGSADDLRARPRSSYVASVVGLNLYRGTARDDRIELPSGESIASAGAGHGNVFATVHPQAVSLYRNRPEGSPRNVWAGRIESVDREGDRARVRVSGSVPIVAEVTVASLVQLGFRQGDDVWASVKATEVTVYPA